MSRTVWDIQRIDRDDYDGGLHGEVASMKGSRTWMWRLMAGRHAIESGQSESRDDAIADMFDAWGDWDERLDFALPTQGSSHVRVSS